MQLILCCSALNCAAAAADSRVTQLTNVQTKAEHSLRAPRKAVMVWRIFPSVILTFLDNDEENGFNIVCIVHGSNVSKLIFDWLNDC